MKSTSAVNDGTADGRSRENTPAAQGPSINEVSCTPIKCKTPLEALFSTYTRFRHETINTLGKEMGRFVTGPMPVNDFLETFLPVARMPDHRSTRTRFRTGAFDATLESRTELEAYGPFVADIQKLVPKLAFVDTHARGDHKNGFGFAIKPDLCVYPPPLKNHKSPLGCDIATIDMHIEFKWQNSEDPFVVPKPSDPRRKIHFIRDSDNARDTIGQISAYAAAQLSAQFRTHVFSIFISRDTARIIRWDREGAVVTEPIAYNEDPSLVQFLSLYSQAPPHLRGIDTTVSPATEDEAGSARAKLNLPSDTPMFKTTIPAINTPTDQSLPPELTVIFPSPRVIPSLPACRGTRACPAYHIEGDRVVFFKDSWRVSSPDIQPEGDIYATLNASHVDHVPVCLACGDVDSCAEQKTQTLKLSESSWACREGLAIDAHTHYRLILDLVGKSLSDFDCSKELVRAIRDALIAHQQAYAAGILHRDVSVGNIIIVDGRGYLIDWDLAKSTSVERPRRATRTGTWQFLSARLVEKKMTYHRIQDDMESTFWVLLWTVLMFSPSSLPLQERSTFIRATFESIPGVQGKRSMIVSQTILEPTLFPGRESLYKLLKALADLFKYYYHKPDDKEVKLLSEVEALEDSPIPLQNILEALPVYQHNESKKLLEDHEHIIRLFSDHLEMEWPADDVAIEQELIGTDCFGADFGKVVVLKSKHVLETVAEEEQRLRKRRRVQTTHGSASGQASDDDPDLVSVDQDYDCLSDDSDGNYHEETESESSHSVLDAFGSSLTSLPSSPSPAIPLTV